jgi:nucleoside phosphorylase
MSDPARILVVAATTRELAAPHPPAAPDEWLTLRCGVGPVDAAASTAAAIAALQPSAILHVGIAGARRRRALAPAALVVGSEARYCDLEVPERFAPRVVAASPALLAAARRALPDAVALPIGTSARVGGTAGDQGCDVEAMEGFAVLRAAQLAGVPAVEVRAIANDIEEDDRARWHFDAAFAAILAVTPRLVAALRSSGRA